jgi:tetratricopeptide (TPR) repeat protein
MSGSLPASTERYRVTDALGQGGMGAVYRAEDRQSGSPVALKRLRLTDNDKRNRSFVELFHQEYRTLAQLAHPHVVQVHDFGTDEQGPFYTMELLEGDDLHSLAPLPWREACALMRDVCSAVALLHSRRLLHRDLSPKNVHRMHEGRAKVIDFGAMSPMGPCKTVVGTAPLVPPEVLLQQPLDARADLYAIGGTFYYVLTGVHAYPARHMTQLRTFWRSRPSPPSALVSGIPVELDALVLSLLSLEPIARPSSAAETLDRIAAIASLPRDEQLAVSRSYLSTPELAGRSAELTHVRQRLAELQAGYGGVLSIDGAPGMGRSRMLDACVLEAKLAGMAAARASAADASSRAYGAVSALVRQLWDMTSAAERAELPLDDVALLREGGITDEVDNSRRAELQSALQVLVDVRARSQPLLLAVDDIDRCDEPSQAALAAAAAAGRRGRVLIAATCTAGVASPENSPLSLLRQGSARVLLTPFDVHETKALLASVFGEAPHVQGLAVRVHERAEGSPRGCMEFAQYLVDRGLVHYEMGSWVLPPALSAADLPGTLSIARRAKLEALSADARELAEALALTQGSGLDFESFAELTHHGDRDRVRTALDELLLAQVLRNEGVNYVFEAQVWVDELCHALSSERVHETCLRIASVLQRLGRDRLEVARYLWRAGEHARTVDTLLEELMAAGTRWDRAPHHYVELLRGAASACSELGRPRRDRIVLLRELVKVGQDLALPDVHEHLRELFAHLRRDSGLDAWDTVDASLDPTTRLQRVYELTQTSHDVAAEADRGLPPLDAIIGLARLSAETCAIAAQTGDSSLFDLVPSLEPFEPISPAIVRVRQQTMPACRAVVAARYEYARDLYQRSLESLIDPTYAGMDEELRVWGIRAIHYAMGCIEAGLGRVQALQHAAELEQQPGWLVPSYSVLQIYHLTLGNLQKAERYRKQIELKLLQSPVKPPLAAGALHQHLFVFALSDNPNGMRQAIPGLEALAAVHPAVLPFVAFARAEHARICGNCEEGLRWLEQVRAQTRPGEHPLWPWVMSSWLLSLFALERYDEARAIAERELIVAEQIGLNVMSDHVRVPLALAEAKLGDLDGACRRLDDVIPKRLASGMQGVVIGWVFEARARVALWMGDNQSFEHHAQLCAQQYKKSGGEPALAAKYDRLMQEARQRGVSLRRELADAMAAQTTAERTNHPSREEDAHTVAAALAACGTRDLRAQLALALLIERAGAIDGELFLLAVDGLQLAASTAPHLGGVAHIPALGRMVDVDLVDDDNTVMTAALALHGPVQPDGTPVNVWPVLLACVRSGATAIAGVAALHFPASAAVRLPLETAAQVAAVLIDKADAAPRILGVEATTLRDG